MDDFVCFVCAKNISKNSQTPLMILKKELPSGKVPENDTTSQRQLLSK